jgi:hypothetical protein
VSCKLCSLHSHITIFSSRFFMWLCQLQTLQASQPHYYFLITLSPLRLCELQTLQASQPHHYFLITLFGVAVSAANFAGFTATSLFSDHAFLCGCVSCKLCGLHSHITIFSSRFPLCGCVSCKLCSHHSHITIFSSRFLVWLCQLQTLQASQPHNYFIITLFGVAVSAANFAVFTATSLFSHHAFWCGCASCKLCSLHSHIRFSHYPFFCGCVSCKLCSHHSHILYIIRYSAPKTVLSIIGIKLFRSA